MGNNTICTNRKQLLIIERKFGNEKQLKDIIKDYVYEISLKSNDSFGCGENVCCHDMDISVTDSKEEV